jgi:hypothetical protein
MRIAIQNFGGLNCCQKCNHLEQFIYLFPEIFNENNEIDFFLLTTKQRDETITQDYLTSILGNQLKVLEFVEDQPNIMEKEEQILEKWNSMNKNVLLSLEELQELQEYKNEVLSGIELRKNRNLYLPSLYEELEKIDRAINDNQTLVLLQDHFVPLLYYRRMLVNNLRKKYQTEHNIQYDWVITARVFDTIFNKLKTFDFLYYPPIKDTVYCSIDNITITTPELTDHIYELLGNHYPVVGYEQWEDEEFKKEYLKVDIGIYFLRTCSTLCSENQMMYTCLKSCNNCIQLRYDNLIESSFLTFQSCSNRKN